MKKLLAVGMLFTCIFAVNANSGVLKFAGHAVSSLVVKSPAHNAKVIGSKTVFPVRHPKQFAHSVKAAFGHPASDAKKVIL